MNVLSFWQNLCCCPKCKSNLLYASKKSTFQCVKCARKYPIRDGIPRFIELNPVSNSESIYSQRQYDEIYAAEGIKVDDKSYEFFALLARGNRTLDIACGEGWIEELAPRTVAIDFSLNALKNARSKGARWVCQASAEEIPFKDSSFDAAISTGNLEHFQNPEEAIKEMARVSKFQVLTVHREFPIPLAYYLRKLIFRIFGKKEQPIERPFRWRKLKKLFENQGLQIIFCGYWLYPMDFRHLWSRLPSNLLKIPSHFFVVTHNIRKRRDSR